MREIGAPERMWATPKVLGEHGKSIWARLGPYLLECGVLTQLHKESFTVLCLCYDRLMQIAEEINNAPQASRVTIEDKRKSLKKQPALMAWKAALVDFRAYSESFGLTPEAMDKLEVKKLKELKPDEKDKSRYFK